MKLPLASLAAALAAASLAVPALAGQNSIEAQATADHGVYFTVTVGGNHDSIEIGVACDSGYETRVTVAVDASGTGTSQTVYPPIGSSCTATLEQGKFIGRFHVLATTTFTVT